MTDEQQKVLDNARVTIEKQIDKRGEYSHNIVGLTLSIVARDCGYNYAND